MVDQIFDQDSVVVAYVHDRNVAYSWHHSMTELLGNDLASHQRVWRAGYISMLGGTDGLASARNQAVEKFLAEKQADWLFWIDTDMGFAGDIIEQLMADADPVERPIVGALAFTWRQEQSDQMGGWRCLATPTIFDWGQDGDQEGFIVRWDYHINALQQCSGTGSACVLIHRSVFEKIAEKFGPGKWYNRVHNPLMDRLISEDLSFCLRAEQVGCTVWVDSAVKTTHLKPIWVGETDYFAQRAIDQMAPDVPPATEPTAVIVPVLGRPQNAKPFMESLQAAGSDVDIAVYAVVDGLLEEEKVVEQAWLEAGANIISGSWTDETTALRPGTFAEKVNWAYKYIEEPWLFIVGDDVRFHPGWLDHAQHASRDGAHVIGTNDLHNPRVVKGDHATHLLIRRAYVDERGASWDGPKVVCHEGYRHNFVDDEIVAVAKQRGVWAFTRHAKVEHKHPMWGGAEIDDTYRLGASSYEQDQELWQERLVRNAGEPTRGPDA